MFAAFDIGMRKFVDQHNLRLPRENAVNIHLLKSYALVFNFFPGNLLELFGQLCRTRPAVRFYNTDHDVLAALASPDRLAQHGVCLAHARCVPEEELEGATGLLRRDLFKPFFRALSHRVRVIASAHRDKIALCSAKSYAASFAIACRRL